MIGIHFASPRAGMSVLALCACVAMFSGAVIAQTQTNAPVTGNSQNLGAQAVQNSAAGSLNAVRGAPGAAAHATQGSPSAGAGIPLMPLPSTGDGFSNDALRSGAQQRQIDSAQQQLELMQLRMQMNELMKKMQGASANNAELPMLVGISGARQNAIAEFYTGGALLQARPGEWVTSQWRLQRILQNGVVLVKAGSGRSHTLLFGAGTVQGSVQAPSAAAAPVPGAGG